MAKKVMSKTGKKKNWYKIVAPKVFNEVEVGETQAVAPEDLVGRTVKSSLMSFTRNIKKQNVTVKLKVKEVKDNKGICEITEFSMSPSAVKRLVKRRRDKVDDSFVCKTKDGKFVRVKPMALTKSNASNSTLTSIRHAIKYMIMSRVLNMTYGQFVESVLNDKLVRDVKKTLNYVYPARMVSIRSFKLEENSKVKMSLLTELDKKVYDDAAQKSKDKEKNPTRAAPKVHANDEEAVEAVKSEADDQEQVEESSDDEQAEKTEKPEKADSE